MVPGHGVNNGKTDVVTTPTIVLTRVAKTNDQLNSAVVTQSQTPSTTSPKAQ
jgi:hypothetical protein